MFLHKNIHPTVLQSTLLFALFGIAGGFYGNLYEAVVLVPEWQISPRSISHWASPYAAKSPTRYYVPIEPLSTIALWLGLGMTGRMPWRTNSLLRRWLLFASICGLATQGLTAYIVLQLNMPLFFDADRPPYSVLVNLLDQWELFNAFRIVLRAATLLGLFQSFLQLIRDQQFNSRTVPET